MIAPNESAKRGLKLLSARHRKLHPRAQVQTLRRVAVRALNKADWQEQLARESNGAWPADPKEVAELRTKAADATEAMLYLNRSHSLGYPV